MSTMNLQPTERDVVDEIRTLVNRFTEGWEKLDSGQVLSTITRCDDIVIFGTDEVEHWVGFDALVEPFEAMVKEIGRPHYAWGPDEPRIWVLGDTGCASGVLTLTFEDKGEPRRIFMRSTFVAIRLDKSWSIAHAHFSVGERALPASPATALTGG